MGVFSLPSLERDDVRPSVYHYSTHTLAVDENDHPEPFFFLFRMKHLYLYLNVIFGLLHLI